MASNGGSSRRSLSMTSSSSLGKKKTSDNGGPDTGRRSMTSSRHMGLTGERTVKRLRLSKALTIPESTSVADACRRMAARKVDALLLTDSNALLCGILTDKDIATRVIACELDLEDTPASKVMTRNPIFVLSDTFAVEALHKMVQGKFRHLPVVENGEVIALLDIAKCLYDAIARMERAAEKGKAIAAAVEGVEKHWGAGPNSFVETLRERMFKPSLSTIIAENSKIATVLPTDSVLMACKKMLELRISSAIVTVENKPRGILTSKDILMRVIAHNLSPESTLVEKVMTPNPECATVDTPIVDALHTMHEGKFLHLPVVDTDGNIVAVVDVINITHAAVATASQVGNTAGSNNEAASTLMQKFWDSALALTPNDDDDETRSESSLKVPSEGTETRLTFPGPSPVMPNTFSFKIQDKMGLMHRFNCDTRSLAELITAILQRLGDDIDRNNLPQIMYEDEDKDKCVLATDNDLIVAVDHARSSGWKGLRLHLDYSKGKSRRRKGSALGGMEYANNTEAWASAYSAVAAGAALVAGLGVLTFLRRAGN